MYDDEQENRNDIGAGENPPSPQEPEENLYAFSEEADPSAPSENFKEQEDASQETEQQAADPYQGMSEKEYKANIKRMKREYKQFQKDKKRSAKAERNAADSSAAQQQYAVSRKRGIGAGTSFVLSLLTSFIMFVVIFGALAFFPSKEKSFLASLYSDSKSSVSGKTDNPSGNDVQIGNQTVSKGDNVTINVNGDSEIAQAVYAKAANSVVGIAVSQVTGSKWNQYEQVVSMGSGIVYSADGIIVTNCHVVESAIDSSTGGINVNYAIRIYFKTDLSEWAYATELIGYDATNDIAVLRVDAKNLQPIEFADSDTLTTGETAITIGSPGGLTYMNSVSEGILSGINRTVTTNNTTVYDLIQTTAAINPGNSGGALLNKEGKLIGLCVIKIVSTEYEGMGFAINSNTVKTIVESIKEYGYYNKPLLGITVNTNYTATVAAQQGWKRGAYIEEVSASSGAEKAGIKKDDIITKINDTEIASFEELRRFLLTCRPGDTIKVEVYRTDSGKTLNFEVVLDETKPA
ncbi:MAG: S1C family serine protease [Clostridia bacterium]